MSARLAHMRTMLGLLADGKGPYGTGPWGANHIEVYADDAQVLVDVIDELMRLRGEAAENERLRRDLGLQEEVTRQVAERADELRAELEIRRATVTTGGPAPALTQQWENGPSTRPPTAPPEPEVVQLPRHPVHYIDEPPAR